MPRKQDFDFQFADSDAAWARMDQKSDPMNSWGTMWNKLAYTILAVVSLYDKVWKN